MASRLRQEIKQRKPFASLEQEVVLNVVRTADALQQAIDGTLRPAGISSPQYNVLRILRGAGERGLCCREVAERMLTHDPDITRLLDRLERRGLVMRERHARDRRIITVRITPEGLQLLQELDRPLLELHARLLGHLGPERQAALVELLEAARAGGEGRDSKVVSGK